MGLLDSLLMDDDDWTPKRGRRNGTNRSQNNNRSDADPLETSIDLDGND